MRQQCYIVIYSCHSGETGAYALWNEVDAKQSVMSDANIEIASLESEGYTPILMERSDNEIEVYVPDTGIYYDWNIVQSTIE